MIGGSSGLDFYLRRTDLVLSRNYMKALTNGVHGENQCGFNTEVAARAYYMANRHLVQVVRTCRADDIRFGLLEEAYDVNWQC
jgi:hypothetical protein